MACVTTRGQQSHTTQIIRQPAATNRCQQHIWGIGVRCLCPRRSMLPPHPSLNLIQLWLAGQGCASLALQHLLCLTAPPTAHTMMAALSLSQRTCGCSAQQAACLRCTTVLSTHPVRFTSASHCAYCAWGLIQPSHAPHAGGAVLPAAESAAAVILVDSGWHAVQGYAVQGYAASLRPWMQYKGASLCPVYISPVVVKMWQKIVEQRQNHSGARALHVPLCAPVCARLCGNKHTHTHTRACISSQTDQHQAWAICVFRCPLQCLLHVLNS